MKIEEKLCNEFYDLVGADTQDQIIAAVSAINPYFQKDPSGSLFFRGNSNVLAVAHLDTVSIQSDDTYPVYGSNKPSRLNPLLHDAHVDKRELTITSINLDDRLGAWFLLSELAHLDFDILLTDGEEYGQTTGMFFIPDKEYNWVFEFDRHGYNNVVMYQYDNLESRDLLTAYGYNVEYGSYSDISDMDHIHTVKFNFSTGYTRQHTPHCFTVPSLWGRMVDRFSKFYEANKNTKMPFVSTGNRRDKWKVYDYKPYSPPKKALPATTTTSSGMVIPVSKSYTPEFDSRMFYLYDDTTDLFMNSYGQYSCARCLREDLDAKEVYLFSSSTYEQLCVDCMTADEYNEMLNFGMDANYKFYNLNNGG